MSEPGARLGGQWAWGLESIAHSPSALQAGGRWAVVLPYTGAATFLRFAHWSPTARSVPEAGGFRGPAVSAWRSSMDQAAYCAAVEETRQRIARGDLYQANICRVLRAGLPDASAASVRGLGALLDAGNPAPFGGWIDAPDAGVQLVTASPELFLRRRGDALMSSPIKGTGKVAADLQAKDEAENVMIVDLVRNDLSRVCVPGSVEVPSLLRVESHPGLVHLVSDVVGRLEPDAGWPEIIDAAFPPGSVTGAPKSSALRVIDELEASDRSVYCGAIGWIDADTDEAELAVAIRTFWIDGEDLCFGTGAGITWGSDPLAEWAETELKAQRLIDVAAGVWQGGRS